MRRYAIAYHLLNRGIELALSSDKCYCEMAIMSAMKISSTTHCIILNQTASQPANTLTIQPTVSLNCQCRRCAGAIIGIAAAAMYF